MAETMLNVQKIRVKFRLFQARFYHTALLAAPTMTSLRGEISRRLGVDSSHIAAIVQDQDILVSEDEDIIDGLVLDIFLSEQ